MDVGYSVGEVRWYGVDEVDMESEMNELIYEAWNRYAVVYLFEINEDVNGIFMLDEMYNSGFYEPASWKSEMMLWSSI